ncbi:ChbG/HpnK family deacetylase [Granulicella sp. dw_53]|uniref:ChbG/HpnK family deacetylase n=1 Tax=Granulicella sp. dw_53 TaxID=2719792 RepID=UPI001BD2F8A4|nr:ChbG/HpnK family deacetylase [Granulicella sp. dw_53]
MPPRLILNADDFGLTPGVNRAIAELHQAGVLTSATLMATGPAFDDAVAIAHANPTLGVGCHITLVDGTPVAHPQSIPTLIGSDGKTLRPSLIDFTQALLRGDIHEDDIEREALAQLQKLQRAGIDVTHLDTHKHTHLFSAVARPLLHLAQRASIGAIRNPFEPSFTRALGHGGLLRRLQIYALNSQQARFMRIPQIVHNHVLTTDGTLGISATGHLNANTLAETLAALPSEGLFEFCCHPGYNDPDLDAITTRLRGTRDVEREALLKVLPQRILQPGAPELIHYGDLGFMGAMRKLGRFQPNTGYEKIL